MATIHGARGLGLAEEAVLLTPGPKEALLAVALVPGSQERIAVQAPVHDLLGGEGGEKVEFSDG